MKRYAFLTAVSIIFFLMLSNCETPSAEDPPAIYSDPAFQILLSVRNELTQRVIERNIPKDKLWAAYQQKDTGQLALLLGLTPEDLKILNYRLQTARTALLKKYPEVRQAYYEMLSNDAYTHKINREFPLDKIVQNPKLAEPDCDWVKYTAALLVCTTAGPVIYWPCAYLALCSFCQGGWVDTVCQY